MSEPTAPETNANETPPVNKTMVWIVVGTVVFSMMAEAYHRIRSEQLRDTTPQVTDFQKLEDGTRFVELLTPRYALEDVYMSMEGPNSNHPLVPVSLESEELVKCVKTLASDENVWLTGLETTLIDADSEEVISPEFFCHGNLTISPYQIDIEAHQSLFGAKLHQDWRLITLVPGKMDIHFPPGFGIPLKNSSRLDYFTMALNQNPGLPSRDIKMKSRVYTTEKPTKPLFQRALSVYQRYVLEPGLENLELLPGLNFHDSLHPGALCSDSGDENVCGPLPSVFEAGENTMDVMTWHPGAACCVASASQGGIIPEKYGDEHTIHWMVPPGNHRYRSEVTEQLDLPFDTTSHYVTGHLHPMGTSLKLVEMDTQKVVFDITAKCRTDRMGVVEMSEIQSIEGVPLQAGKRYELIAEYNNTSDESIDAMGIMYLYMLEKEHVSDDDKLAQISN